MNPILTKSLLRKYVLSQYMDFLGAAIVLGTCIARDFHRTMYLGGEIVFGVPLEEFGSQLSHGAFPLGIMSTIGAVFSLLSTRLVGKQNNWGNFIGILTTINSGAVDFMFGNHSAVITYPLTFLITTFALVRWSRGERIKKIDKYYYIIFGSGIVVAYALVYLGAWIFGGRTDAVFLHIVAITFGLSLGGNFCNALKYEETWLNWTLYNIVQLTKAILQMNIANVAKYIFYLVNSVITWFD